jgi:preprotein translocase subunit YajC
MTHFVFSILFAMAPSPNASGDDAKRQGLMQLGLVVFMLVVMYVMVLRPQQKKAKEQALLLKGLKMGDKVVTSSGILGVVTSVREDTVTLRSAETKLEFQKSAIVQITERAA